MSDELELQNQVRWALSRVVCHMGCVISGRHGTVDFSWRERGQSYRRFVAGSNVHDDERERWLRILHWLHDIVTRDLLRGRESGHGKRFRLFGQEGDRERDPTETP